MSELTQSILAMLKTFDGYAEINDLVTFYSRDENGSEFKGDVLDAIGELRKAGTVELYGPDSLRGVRIKGFNKGNGITAHVIEYPDTSEKGQLVLEVNAPKPMLRNNGYNQFPIHDICVDLDLVHIPEMERTEDGKPVYKEFDKYTLPTGHVVNIGGWTRLVFTDGECTLHGAYSSGCIRCA
jgi:hypothetical protein